MDSTVNDGLSPFFHDKNPPSGIMVQNKLLQVLAVRELWVISHLLPHLIKHVAVEITVHDSLHTHTSQRKIWSITFIGICLSTPLLPYLIVHSLLVPEIGVVQSSVHPHSGIILL